MKKTIINISLLFLTTIILFACKKREIKSNEMVEMTTFVNEQKDEYATSEIDVNAKSAEVIFTDEELEQFRIAEEMAKKEKETIVETTKPLTENKESTGFDKDGLPYLLQQKFDGWQYVEVNNEIVAKSNNAQIDYVFNTILGEAKEDPIEEIRNKIYEYTKKNVEESNTNAIELIKKGYMFTYNNEGFPNEAPPQGTTAMQIINPNNGLKYCYLNAFGKQEWAIDTTAHQNTRGELNLNKIMRHDGAVAPFYHMSEDAKREISENIARAYK